MLALILFLAPPSEPVRFTVPTTFTVPPAATTPVTFTVAATFTIADPPLEQCPCGATCDCGRGDACRCQRYTPEIRAEAIRENTFLILWVGQKCGRAIPGTLTCRSDSYGGDKTPCVMVLRGERGQLWEHKRIVGTPTMNDIYDTIRPAPRLQYTMPRLGGT